MDANILGLDKSNLNPHKSIPVPFKEIKIDIDDRKRFGMTFGNSSENPLDPQGLAKITAANVFAVAMGFKGIQDPVLQANGMTDAQAGSAMRMKKQRMMINQWLTQGIATLWQKDPSALAKIKSDINSKYAGDAVKWMVANYNSTNPRFESLLKQVNNEIAYVYKQASKKADYSIPNPAVLAGIASSHNWDNTKKFKIPDAISQLGSNPPTLLSSSVFLSQQELASLNQRRDQIPAQNKPKNNNPLDNHRPGAIVSKRKLNLFNATGIIQKPTLHKKPVLPPSLEKTSGVKPVAKNNIEKPASKPPVVSSLPQNLTLEQGAQQLVSAGLDAAKASKVMLYLLYAAGDTDMRIPDTVFKTALNIVQTNPADLNSIKTAVPVGQATFSSDRMGRKIMDDPKTRALFQLPFSETQSPAAVQLARAASDLRAAYMESPKSRYIGPGALVQLAQAQRLISAGLNSAQVPEWVKSGNFTVAWHPPADATSGDAGYDALSTTNRPSPESVLVLLPKGNSQARFYPATLDAKLQQAYGEGLTDLLDGGANPYSQAVAPTGNAPDLGESRGVNTIDWHDNTGEWFKKNYPSDLGDWVNAVNQGWKVVEDAKLNNPSNFDTRQLTQARQAIYTDWQTRLKDLVEQAPAALQPVFSALQRQFAAVAENARPDDEVLVVRFQLLRAAYLLQNKEISGRLLNLGQGLVVEGPRINQNELQFTSSNGKAIYMSDIDRTLRLGKGNVRATNSRGDKGAWDFYQAAYLSLKSKDSGLNIPKEVVDAFKAQFKGVISTNM